MVDGVLSEWAQDCATRILPKTQYLGGEGGTFIQRLFLDFEIVYYSIVESKRYNNKPKLEKSDNVSNDNFKASQDKRKVVRFEHFPKGKAHDIKESLE